MDSVKDMAEFFKLLSDPTRLKLLQMLAQASNDLCVGALARSLSVSQPAVSQHLKTLKQAKLITGERNGFHVHYALNKESFSARKINVDELFKGMLEGVDKISCTQCPSAS